MLSRRLRLGFLVLLLLGLPALAAAAPGPVLVLGDSLSAAYGIPVESGWVALLERRLREQGYPQRVVNASISGETTAGGLARLPQALAAHRPGLVLIELGANDGLRGLPLEQMRANLKKMVALSRQAGAEPLLFEMRLPGNYGPRYTEEFRGSFARLARAERVPLVPFLLASVILDPQWMLEDGIHPNAAAQPRLLDAVWPTLAPLLGKPSAAQARAAR